MSSSFNNNFYPITHPEIKEYISAKLNYVPFCIKFQPYTPKMVLTGGCADGSGILQLYSFKHGQLSILTEMHCSSWIKNCTFNHSQFSSQEIAVGGFDGYLANIDLEKGLPLFEIKKAHKGVITDIDGIGGNFPYTGSSLILTSSKDGYTKVWDARTNKTVLIFDNSSSAIDNISSSDKANKECWAACFINGNICIGYDNGDLK